MQRQMARARSFGIEFEFVSPQEAGRRAPILRTDDLAGAVWIPGDGKANPTDLTQSLAKGARMRGARIVEGAQVTGVEHDDGRTWPASTGRRRRRARRDRLRDARQLRRPVGARVRSPRRRQRAAVLGRALLHRHRADCRRGTGPAGDPRSGRLHLLQGGSRRPGDGRFRAAGEALERGADSGRLRVPAAARGLGPVRGPHELRNPPHAVPRDRRGEDAAQRAGELHARRQLHPRRSA